MVECIRPKPMTTIADPARGTRGFFLAAYDSRQNYSLYREQTCSPQDNTFSNEIMQSTRRLALMNMFLYNIGDITGESIISSAEVRGQKAEGKLLKLARLATQREQGFHAPLTMQ